MRRLSPSTGGTVSRRGPRLTQTRMLRCVFSVDPAAGSWLTIRSAGDLRVVAASLDPQQQPLARRQRARFGDPLLHEGRNRDLLRGEHDPHGGERADAGGGHEGQPPAGRISGGGWRSRLMLKMPLSPLPRDGAEAYHERHLNPSPEPASAARSQQRRAKKRVAAVRLGPRAQVGPVARRARPTPGSGSDAEVGLRVQERASRPPRSPRARTSRSRRRACRPDARPGRPRVEQRALAAGVAREVAGRARASGCRDGGRGCRARSRARPAGPCRTGRAKGGRRRVRAPTTRTFGAPQRATSAASVRSRRGEISPATTSRRRRRGRPGASTCRPGRRRRRDVRPVRARPGARRAASPRPARSRRPAAASSRRRARA